MPTFIRNKAKFANARDNGFTLVELMVVIFIIGLASAAVVLSLPGGEARLGDDASRFAARLVAVRDDAILQSRGMAVWVSPSAYGFETRRNDDWVPIEARGLGTVNWTPGTSAVVGTAGRQRISFDSTGLPSGPLDVTLVRGDVQTAVRLDAAGKVSVGE